MTASPRPFSLVAERAVRFLRAHGLPVSSRILAREVLATAAGDEASATTVLEAAFVGDQRLAYREGSWTLTPEAAPRRKKTEPDSQPDPARTLLFVKGVPRSRGRPFRLTAIAALRLHDDKVLSACGGDVTDAAHGNRLRRATLETLDGAVPVIHDPPGSLKALEEWLGEPLAAPISLRRLAQERVGLAASHDLEALVARLGLPWRATDDPLEQADTLDRCLQSLRRPGEALHDLRSAHGKGASPLDWSRYAFNREFLRSIPHVAGTYRFYDGDGRLLYVGKSKNLHRRIGSYFREEGRKRSERVQRLLESVYRIEYEATCSDLEAILREAEAIRREGPERNVQRHVRSRRGRAGRLRSILILEPASPPAVLRAYLIRDGRLIDRITIGPRGGGLARIERVLQDCFFSAPEGPTPLMGPDLDIELVVRWLSANRDRVVAFDPTDLPSTDEVIERLRWFLGQGSPFDHDGNPVFRR